MTDPIPINLAVEDALSETVLRRLLAAADRAFAVGTCYSESGYGYLKRTIAGFNAAARGTPFLVLTDLDRATCPSTLIREWLHTEPHPNLLFRIARREVEAWLLAHADAMARFLRIRSGLIPRDPESLADPKRTLIDLAARSRSRDIRGDLVPPRGSSRVQGPDYNGRMAQFVNEHWDPAVAAASAESLRRALRAVNAFQPRWSRGPRH